MSVETQRRNYVLKETVVICILLFLAHIRFRSSLSAFLHRMRPPTIPSAEIMVSYDFMASVGRRTDNKQEKGKYLKWHLSAFETFEKISFNITEIFVLKVWSKHHLRGCAQDIRQRHFFKAAVTALRGPLRSLLCGRAKCKKRETIFWTK